jgi:hypothetical protein
MAAQRRTRRQSSLRLGYAYMLPLVMQAYLLFAINRSTVQICAPAPIEINVLREAFEPQSTLPILSGLHRGFTEARASRA